MLGPFQTNKVHIGDCSELIKELPDESIDIVFTSPPYWGQRHSLGMGIEHDPRDYLVFLTDVFGSLLSKMKPRGIVWINIGDAYNTPVNWAEVDRNFSTLGADRTGLPSNNSAYIKPRIKRKAFLEKETSWLQYGNLLALPYRLALNLCDCGYLFRGEVIWRKKNPMPEGRCRRPHRCHESIYLFAKNEDHHFSVIPPVKSVWEFANEKINGLKHFSRFPEELPFRGIESYGVLGKDIIVLDPFSGSGTTGMAALKLGCTYIGFEIDVEQAEASNERLDETAFAKTRVLF